MIIIWWNMDAVVRSEGEFKETVAKLRPDIVNDLGNGDN